MEYSEVEEILIKQLQDDIVKSSSHLVGRPYNDDTKDEAMQEFTQRIAIMKDEVDKHFVGYFTEIQDIKEENPTINDAEQTMWKNPTVENKSMLKDLCKINEIDCVYPTDEKKECSYSHQVPNFSVEFKNLPNMLK